MSKVIPNDSGTSFSPWMQITVPDYWGELATDARTDVCIIGAGIAGLSVAYHLCRAGKRVIVIDDGPIGGGETSRTTAHLASALDDRFWWLEKIHGAEGARLAAASHAEAIDDIEAIIDAEEIDCEFERVDGYLFTPPGTSTDELTRELAAAHRAGLTDAELVGRTPLMGFDTGPALRFPRQAQFHPIKYLRGLAAAVVRHGGKIYSGVRAEGIESSGETRTVVTEGKHHIECDSVVVATNAPINSMVAIPIKQAAYRSYVVGLLVPRDSVPAALYWDTEEPYHYARVLRGGPEADNDLLIVGGEDHRTGQIGDDDSEARYARLVEWARSRFVGATHLVAQWSGQIMEPADGLAFIGKSPGKLDNVYVATGDSGNGMTHGAIAGLLLTDLILGQANPWTRVYEPRRSSLRAPREFLREAARSTIPYTDWLTGGDVGSEDEIEPGQGAVVRHGLRMIASYRDDSGTLHQRSAVCPHLGGVVAWNNGEKTWDCPCHGSRFDALGRVINGPAATDLAVHGDTGDAEAPAHDEDDRPLPVTTFGELDPFR